MFNHVEVDYFGNLVERRVKNKRHYETPDGNMYPSVTTVTNILSKQGIDKWKSDMAKKYGVEGGKVYCDQTMIQSTTVGTEFHNICECYLSNKPISQFKNLIPLAHFNNIKEYLDNIDNIHGLETRLYSDELGLAGTTDCIAEYDGQPSIIDFKTSKKEKKSEWIIDYFQQATAYSLMWKERTNLDFQQVVIIMSGLDGSKEVFIRNRNDYIDDLKETIKLYNDFIG